MRTVAALLPPVLLAATLAAAQRPVTNRRVGADPRALVARAITAMGGDSALRALRAVTIENYGMQFGLGQEETPRSPARASASGGRIISDYAGRRRLSDVEVRSPAGAVNRSRRVTTSTIGMLESQGSLTADNPGAVAGQQAAMRRAPERLLLAALDSPSALTALRPRQWRGELMDGVRYAAAPDTLDLWFDRPTGRLVVTETVTDDPILGDRHAVTWYTRWQPTDGVWFARQVDVEVNGRLQAHSNVTSVTVNPATPDSLFAIPDSIAQRASPANTAPPAITVTLAELAPGVWRAEGGTHHSLVVEQPAGLVVVEAPQNARRFNAVLDTLRARFPGKRVSVVANTHHHWDHAGGVRAALAAALPIVTHARNAEFLREIGTARKTVTPDALSRVARPPVVRGVTDSLVIGAGDRRVVVYQLPTAHAEGMLAAYVPAAQLLFTSDVLSPGPTLAAAGSRELVAFVRARGLTVARVAGGHGGVAEWAQVERAASGR
jgi:glyoxylase-like metal-dependent hydrolase (beta-lactamase superfamily II)